MAIGTSLFSTTLKQVTGFFDRHGLVSAFFPNLIFWGVTCCLILGDMFGWQTTIQTWEGHSVTVQALSLIGFFTWVAFCAFLTVNFQSSLMRLYEGYWPTEGSRFLKQRGERQRRQYREQWAQWKGKDAELEQQQITILLLQRQLSLPIEQLRKTTSVPNDLAAAERSLLDALESLEPESSHSSAIALTTASLTTVLPKAEQLQQQRHYWQASQALVQSSAETQRWEEYKQTIHRLTQQLKQQLGHLLGEVEENRHRLNRQQFLYLPARLDDILPTQLGNVMKAAELYSQERYNIDAVLIWPRLQSFLPEGFASTLQDAKTSLDLMVTLSAFCLIFGLPLSAWLGLRAEAGFLAISPVCITLLAVAMRQGKIAIAAFLASILSLAFSIFPATRVLPLIRLNVLVTLGAGSLLVSRLSYENAMQAALSYGEQLKAAFDLYRWKALEGLNLKLPNNLQEERSLWGEVCGLLYRGYSSGLGHYQYRVSEEATHLEIASPEVEPTLLDGQVMVGIPATPAMVFGGELEAGMRIKLCFADAAGASQVIEDVVVAKVSEVEAVSTMGDPGANNTYVLNSIIKEIEVEKWRQRLNGGEVVVLMG